MGKLKTGEILLIAHSIALMKRNGDVHDYVLAAVKKDEGHTEDELRLIEGALVEYLLGINDPANGFLNPDPGKLMDILVEAGRCSEAGRRFPMGDGSTCDPGMAIEVAKTALWKNIVR